MADRRTLVSYDDLETPQAAGSAQLGPPLPSTTQPPAKKRRTHQKAPPRRTQQHVQHWDDPGTEADAMNYGSEAAGAPENEEDAEEEEESRELTHEEIWDDSALIDAWNSATAEYEAYHGKGKSWKDEPVKKSPLWYNVPPSPSKLANGKGKGKQTNGAAASPTDDGANSKPLDFNTFVPSHDPSLATNGDAEQAEAHAAEYPQSYLPAASGALVGQDEAFEKALNAMYWSGYWTAVYHYHRQQQSQGGPSQADGEAEEEGDENGEGDADDLIDTQR